MPVHVIVDNFDYGVSVAEIAEQFEIPVERVQTIVTYAQNHRIAHHRDAAPASARNDVSSGPPIRLYSVPN